MQKQHTDKTTTLAELTALVVKFREERGWGKHHTPKNLAVSIAIEAAELMEHFQWDDYTRKDRQEIVDELSDILIYCFLFADTMDIDISTSFMDKLARASKKYPVDTFNRSQDRSEDYKQIKQMYRKAKK